MLVRNKDPLVPTNILGTKPSYELPSAIVNFVASPDPRGQTERGVEDEKKENDLARFSRFPEAVTETFFLVPRRSIRLVTIRASVTSHGNVRSLFPARSFHRLPRYLATRHYAARVFDVTRATTTTETLNLSSRGFGH